MLDQEGVALWNNGACPLAEHLPKLTAELLREIVGHVLDGNTVIYQDGIIKVMQPR